MRKNSLLDNGILEASLVLALRLMKDMVKKSKHSSPRDMMFFLASKICLMTKKRLSSKN